MHIDICVCTFRRASIIEALRSLDAQIVPNGVSLAIIVADNDDTPSARKQVEAAAETIALPVKYIHAPARNISIVRNACLDAVRGDWLAFFDDDQIAEPNWIMHLVATAKAETCDAVFGPVIATYGADAPAWIVRRDYHTSVPERCDGVVQTGHAGSALIRVSAPMIAGQRFLLEKGRTGGEDTEFFYRIWRAGAKLGIADKAISHEPVPAGRLTFSWLKSRKFRSGISYGLHALPDTARLVRVKLTLLSALKCGVCVGAGLVSLPFPSHRNFWFLRAVFHAGACASTLRIKEQELYGGK